MYHLLLVFHTVGFHGRTYWKYIHHVLFEIIHSAVLLMVFKIYFTLILKYSQ